MTGKWHLGEGPGRDPLTGVLNRHLFSKQAAAVIGMTRGHCRPCKKWIIHGTANWLTLPQDFYSTRNYTDSLISFIDKNKNDKKPFFAYLSYTAVHDPLHAPEEYIEKYKGKFDMGWDSLRLQRMNNLKALGIIPEDFNRLPDNPSIPKWKTLSHEQQQEFARDMEVYAAMLDYMDMSIGRVFDYLKKDGLYDNTIIILMSDNGANGADSLNVSR